jgi:hypothetical protein
MTCNVDLGSLYLTDERRDTDNLFRHVLGFSLSKAQAQPELSLEYYKDYTNKQTIYIGVHGTRVAAVPEPLFEAKDVALRIVDALQKTLKAMQTDESQLQAPSTAELKTNFEATNGGGEGPINVKISVRGLEVLILVRDPWVRSQVQRGVQLHEHLP